MSSQNNSRVKQTLCDQANSLENDIVAAYKLLGDLVYKSKQLQKQIEAIQAPEVAD